MKSHISIAGAGIGGLTTGLYLKKVSSQFSIFEAAPEIKPLGAGIILANNAMQVYKELGIHTKLESLGNRISCIKITDEQLNTLSLTDLTSFEKKYRVSNLAIHRGDLQQTLIDELGPEILRTGKRISNIHTSDKHILTFGDGQQVDTDFIIGADGIHSIVRNHFFKKSIIRNAQQICWRGVCETTIPSRYHHEANEAWGKGKRVGFVKINDRKVYWYALINTAAYSKKDQPIASYFSEFHNDILDLLHSTSPENIIRNDILDLKPIDNWHTESVCLVGDAAHATTPNMGQGACQAIEDAYVLGNCLLKGMSVSKSFSEFEKLRKKKAQHVVNTSWAIGKIAHVEAGYAAWLRNFILKNTPSSFNQKQMENLFTI